MCGEERGELNEIERVGRINLEPFWIQVALLAGFGGSAMWLLGEDLIEND